MIAIKAHFDGKRVILPAEAGDLTPGDVILVFEGESGSTSETTAWMKAQESTFAQAWENDDDAVYDTL